MTWGTGGRKDRNLASEDEWKRERDPEERVSFRVSDCGFRTRTDVSTRHAGWTRDGNNVFVGLIPVFFRRPVKVAQSFDPTGAGAA